MKLRVAAVQFDVIPGDTAANLETARQYLTEAAEAGAKVIVLPEVWHTGFHADVISNYTEADLRAALDTVQEVAARYGIHIAAGTLPEPRKGKLYNTCYLVDDKGEIVTKYRKCHLFRRGFVEPDYFEPGEEWCITDLNIDGCTIRTGLAICYDLRFPEFFRNLALRGCRLLLVPVCWPKVRAEEYKIFCRSRALENRCFMISSNHSDSAERSYPGLAMVNSPVGEVIACADHRPQALVTDIDLDILNRTHLFGVFEERLPFLDEIDNNLL